MKNKQQSESLKIAILLALVGGFLDAYTYCCRDQVFANAQTGNIVKLGMTLAKGEYIGTIRYLIPIMAFSLGVLVAMYIRNNNGSKLHWRQTVLFIETGIIVIVAFIPVNHMTNIIANVLISFLCAMQAESFRKVLGQPFSSTMCTGNLRSSIENLYKAFIQKNFQLLKNTACYLLVIISFIMGAYSGVHLTGLFLEKSVLITFIPFLLAIWMMYRPKYDYIKKKYQIKKIAYKIKENINMN